MAHAQTFDGQPLEPGVNLDRLSVKAGMQFAYRHGFLRNAREVMTLDYALNRWAKGEEELAEKLGIHQFGMTAWRMCLAAAMAGAVEYVGRHRAK
jgi:hypothetical protein